MNTKKAYGNRAQDEYVSWFGDFAPLLREMVTEDGSVVIEMGNAWMPGKPVMSTHVLKAFLAFPEKADCTCVRSSSGTTQRGCRRRWSGSISSGLGSRTPSPA